MALLILVVPVSPSNTQMIFSSPAESADSAPQEMFGLNSNALTRLEPLYFRPKPNDSG